ncbi:hypothetical protein [Geitlerinema sp. PCC 9228]|uniref:hypothetical protein n=1 Tax=Geitlerinema sp. PCC 9228 TaxID=111611 RepID=UPI001114B620|nr:hypothetical protein [Geitlerinema sp. PCC 9228]
METFEPGQKCCWTLHKFKENERGKKCLDCGRFMVNDAFSYEGKCFCGSTNVVPAIAIHSNHKPTPPTAPIHQREAIELHKLITKTFGLLAIICIAGGIYAIAINSNSNTEIQIFGAQISTEHVGVAFVGIGVLLTFFTIRSVLNNQRDLAALPLNSQREISRKENRKRSRSKKRRSRRKL